MTDKEVVIGKPDVGLYAHTSSRERVVQRHFAPVVIVRMARSSSDVSTKVRGVACIFQDDEVTSSRLW